MWALLSGFVNTSNWPLCSRTHQICLWLATMINASKTCCKWTSMTLFTECLHRYTWERLKAGVYQWTRPAQSVTSTIDLVSKSVPLTTLMCNTVRMFKIVWYLLYLLMSNIKLNLAVKRVAVFCYTVVTHLKNLDFWFIVSYII